ncbi:MAG: YdiU family protein [Pseudomonadota bacterium]
MSQSATTIAAFDNSYARLPERFFTRQAPEPVPAPELLVFNDALAQELGLDLTEGTDLAGLFSGNTPLVGAAPLAQVYAGHQFGGWVPQLGDGRAVLLGEVINTSGERRDIQLKGAGRTPYSRAGDGRAWLGPVLREYLMSEAMAALGVPTTRALAAVATGEQVLREDGPLPGAILTRVAASHIRVGTFQYFAARGDTEALAALTEHALARHYPGADGPRGLLQSVVARQAALIARWMALGFIHGVMNTDNCAISGETIDYGPCAFMDSYAAGRVFSSIDQFGRYAYANQPQIAVWNLAQLGSAMIPLMPDQEAAIADFTEDVNGFSAQFEQAWHSALCAKLGLDGARKEDVAMAFELLTLMQAGQADFTRVFRGLSEATERARDEFLNREEVDGWLRRWQERLQADGGSLEAAQAGMRAVNPAVIARTHRIEAAIAAAVAGDMAPFQRLSQALSTPFALSEEHADLALAPSQDEAVTRTFCGT